MTTEEALRKALLRVMPFAQDSKCKHVSDLSGNEDRLYDAMRAARAALAIPPTEERIEYRVAYEFGYEGITGFKTRTSNSGTFMELSEARNFIAFNEVTGRRDFRIESRAVSTGPWLPLEAKS